MQKTTLPFPDCFVTASREDGGIFYIFTKKGEKKLYSQILMIQCNILIIRIFNIYRDRNILLSGCSES